MQCYLANSKGKGWYKLSIWVSSLLDKCKSRWPPVNSETEPGYKTDVRALPGSLWWCSGTSCLTQPLWLILCTGCAEKNLTTLSREGNRITHCSLALAALTDMWQHITWSHGRVAAVPCHTIWQMLPPLSKDTWSPPESSPELPWLSAQDAEISHYLRREGWSLQWFGIGSTVRSDGPAFQDSHPSQEGEAASWDQNQV